MLARSVVVFLVLLLVKHMKCFNSDELCVIECENKTECMKKSCQENNQYSVKCNINYCSKSTKSCKEYLVRSFWKRFKKPITKCPKTWKSKSVCQNKKKCLFKLKIWVFSEVKKIWINCPCNNEYNFKCGNDYCAKNKEACSGFDPKKFSQQLDACKQ